MHAALWDDIFYIITQTKQFKGTVSVISSDPLWEN